jgi:hypothetical protein
MDIWRSRTICASKGLFGLYLNIIMTSTSNLLYSHPAAHYIRKFYPSRRKTLKVDLQVEDHSLTAPPVWNWDMLNQWAFGVLPTQHYVFAIVVSGSYSLFSAILSRILGMQQFIVEVTR